MRSSRLYQPRFGRPDDFFPSFYKELIVMPQPLTEKEGEGLLWMLVEISDEAESHPAPSRATTSLLELGYDRIMISEACDAMQDMACGDTIPDDLSVLDKDILRACVEHSTWITQYRTAEETRHSPQHIAEAVHALRTLADKLTKLGIPVDSVPIR